MKKMDTGVLLNLPRNCRETEKGERHLDNYVKRQSLPHCLRNSEILNYLLICKEQSIAPYVYTP